MNDAYNEIVDRHVLNEMKKMRRQGYANARCGTVARRLRFDVIKTLGAMVRVEKEYHKWVNEREAA